jgi:hypothetical protein
MAILGTELNSLLSGGGNVTAQPHGPNVLHHPDSLTGKAHEGTISTQLSTKGITPAKYVDNKPQ